MIEHKVDLRLEKWWETTGLLYNLDTHMDKKGNFYAASIDTERFTNIFNQIKSYSEKNNLNNFWKMELSHVPIPGPDFSEVPKPVEVPPGKNRCHTCGGFGYI